MNNENLKADHNQKWHKVGLIASLMTASVTTIKILVGSAVVLAGIIGYDVYIKRKDPVIPVTATIETSEGCFDSTTGAAKCKYRRQKNGRILLFSGDGDVDPATGYKLKKVTPQVIEEYEKQQEQSIKKQSSPASRSTFINGSVTNSNIGDGNRINVPPPAPTPQPTSKPQTKTAAPRASSKSPSPAVRPLSSPVPLKVSRSQPTRMPVPTHSSNTAMMTVLVDDEIKIISSGQMQATVLLADNGRHIGPRVYDLKKSETKIKIKDLLKQSHYDKDKVDDFQAKIQIFNNSNYQEQVTISLGRKGKSIPLVGLIGRVITAPFKR